VTDALPNDSRTPWVYEDVPSSVGQCQLIWLDSVPAEVRAAFRPYGRWMATYAPRWLERLRIEFDAYSSNNSSLTVHRVPEYNTANIIVKPSWLGQDDDKRDDDAAHELVHLYHAPMARFTQDLLDALPQDDAAQKAMHALREEQERRADESFTVSMSRLLLTFMPRPRDQR
jgi:hypothetical protein